MRFVPSPRDPKALDVLGRRVFGTVNDSEVLATTALHRGLHESLLPAHDPLEGLYDHPFTTSSRQFFPPRDTCDLVFGFRKVDDAVRRRYEELGICRRKPRKHVHVPEVVAVRVNLPLGRKEMERGKAVVCHDTRRPTVTAVRLAIVAEQAQA